MLPYLTENKLRARALRKNQTEAEQHLWTRLRRKQIGGLLFYRQKPLAQYIVDFYCASAMLVIEIDGAQHDEPNVKEYDVLRTQTLEAIGLRVLRFTNQQVLYDIDGVMQVIRAAVAERGNPPALRAPPFCKGR